MSNNIAAAVVGLVVLSDFVTGQGPPVYNNYLAAQQGVRPPFGPPPAVYGPPRPVEYESPSGGKKLEKELEAVAKKDSKKEHEKSSDGKENYDEYESTPAPGVLSSFSNSMSGAWSK